MDEFVGKEIARIRQLVGEKGQVIGMPSRRVQRFHRAKISQALYLGELILPLLLHLHVKPLGIDSMRC